jgi:hypothetical protein
MTAHLAPQSTWYGLQRWRRKAKHQLRVEPLCRYCKELGRVRPAQVADHVVPVHGDWHRFWLGELQSLCKQCHDKVKRIEEEQGYRPGCDVHGFPLDEKHPARTGDRWPFKPQKSKQKPKPAERPLPKIDLWI